MTNKKENIKDIINHYIENSKLKRNDLSNGRWYEDEEGNRIEDIPTRYDDLLSLIQLMGTVYGVGSQYSNTCCCAYKKGCNDPLATGALPGRAPVFAERLPEHLVPHLDAPADL